MLTRLRVAELVNGVLQYQIKSVLAFGKDPAGMTYAGDPATPMAVTIGAIVIVTTAVTVTDIVGKGVVVMETVTPRVRVMVGKPRGLSIVPDAGLEVESPVMLSGEADTAPESTAGSGLDADDPLELFSPDPAESEFDLAPVLASPGIAGLDSADA